MAVEKRQIHMWGQVEDVAWLQAVFVGEWGMTRDQATLELARRADALRARGAEAVFLFGSTARGEARDDSDLDVFIDVMPGRKFSLIDLAGMHAFLVEELGTDIDLTTRKGLHPKLRERIESEAVRIF